MRDPWRQLEEAERDRRVFDFAAACVVAAVQSSMGRSLPEDEDIRTIVRVGRVIYSEIDRPTKPPKEEEPSEDRPAEPDDIVDMLAEEGTLA